jgi:hypothetical protein
LNGQVRVAVTGLARDDVIARLPAGIEAHAMSDVEAASQLAAHAVDYVIGVCESGGGAALAMSIAIVGPEACVNLSKMGKPAERAELPGLLDGGARAFGIARDHVPGLVPALGDCLNRHHLSGSDARP